MIERQKIQIETLIDVLLEHSHDITMVEEMAYRIKDILNPDEPDEKQEGEQDVPCPPEEYSYTNKFTYPDNYRSWNVNDGIQESCMVEEFLKNNPDSYTIGLVCNCRKCRVTC